MGGRFVFERSIAMELMDWCRLGWVCGPVLTGATRLAILEGVIFRARGKAFTIIPIRRRWSSSSCSALRPSSRNTTASRPMSA